MFKHLSPTQLLKMKFSYTNRFNSSSLIDQFFGGTFDVEMKCIESDEEQATFSIENFLQLSCFISQEVKYMLSGIKSVVHSKIIILIHNYI